MRDKSDDLIPEVFQNDKLFSQLTYNRASSLVWGPCEQHLPRACTLLLTAPEEIPIIVFGYGRYLLRNQQFSMKFYLFLLWICLLPVWSDRRHPFLNRNPSRQFYQTARPPSLCQEEKNNQWNQCRKIYCYSLLESAAATFSLGHCLCFSLFSWEFDSIVASELNNNIFELEEKKIT